MHTLDIDQIIHEDRVYNLNYPLSISLEKKHRRKDYLGTDKIFIVLTCPTLNIISSIYTQDPLQAIREFSSKFHRLWVTLTHTPDDKLTRDDIKIKHTMHDLVHEIEQI